jgi:hypothetical protein
MPNNYREYFDIDPMYFPQINDSSIAEDPECWKRTYPHPTFIEMLRVFERCLARQERRSLWIQGAYGVGKSQCAYTLKRLFDVSEDELRTYWSAKAFEHQTDLLEKLVGHRNKGGGILTVYRYATTDIASPRHFYLEIQKSVRNALCEKGLYEGEHTLKESVIAWIEKPANKKWFNELLSQPQYENMFSQNNADEVLTALRGNKVVTQLMGNIFNLADKEGVTALNINVDRLIDWLTDVIDNNNIKIVFVWDQFGDYFDKGGGEKVDAFQKLCELVNHKPFFFVPVTHYAGDTYIKDNDAWKSVRDRFEQAMIRLPDNIAFNLIGHAFNVKSSAKDDWVILADDLNGRIGGARSAVMKTAKITDQQVIKDIMPLHPMAALLLQNIASAFKSNQRSMFDFIKSSNTDDVKAFQWFIEYMGPFDDHPLLTVDMLWNFFYEKGRDGLTSDIRLILDTFPQQQNLREDEKAVLKAILIMQAIDQRLGGTIDLFKPTGQNLSYVFEGIPNLEGATKADNIAKGLKNKGILVSNPISGGRYVYAAAVLAGDQTKIDSLKKTVRENSGTAKLVTEGGLATVLSLSPALRLRFESEPGTGKITSVTTTDFTRTINLLRDKSTGWNFHAVIAFAKDDAEAATFRKTLRIAVADKQYENIVFIDALSTPLGQEAFEQYVDFSAMALYYQGNQNTSSRESAEKAKRVLDQDWKNRTYNGQFVVYTYAAQEGEKLGNGQGVTSVLQTIVTNKFPYVFDFAKGLTESQLKITPAMKQSAKSGISQATSGVVVGIEKKVFPTVWKIDKYWENPVTASLPISKIKVEMDKRIKQAFAHDGQISIGEIYDFLEETYGFARCNLSAFITGFLLKEYGFEPFRYSDSSGSHEQMTPDRLAEMLSNYISKSPKPTYIVKMTAYEMAFYELTEKAWNIPANSCSSADQAARAVSKKMRDELKLPVWCLEEVDTVGIFYVVQRYIDLVQKEGNEAHKKAVEIGKIAQVKSSLADNLLALLTAENCQKGMCEYLSSFEGGKVMELATGIGAEDNVLADIRRMFGVKHSCLWDKQTGEDEIRKLLTEYSVIKESNIILNTVANSLNQVYKEWRERLKFIGISWEALRAKYPVLVNILYTLLRIYKREDILPEQLKAFHNELVAHGAEIRELLNNDSRVFAKVYEAYLEDLSTDDIAVIKTKVGTGLYDLPRTNCNTKVKEVAEEFRTNQFKSQLFRLWKDKTGTKNPREWSSLYRTPILCCVPGVEFERAKRAFDTLNRNGGTDHEIEATLAFLESTTLFDVLADEEKRNAAFKRDIIGVFSTLLPDLDKVRDALDHLSVDVYDWRENPGVKTKVEQLADAEYYAGGSDKALLRIDAMDSVQLKQYLRRLVKENIAVGIEILANEG